MQLTKQALRWSVQAFHYIFKDEASEGTTDLIFVFTKSIAAAGSPNVCEVPPGNVIMRVAGNLRPNLTPGQERNWRLTSVKAARFLATDVV